MHTLAEGPQRGSEGRTEAQTAPDGQKWPSEAAERRATFYKGSRADAPTLALAKPGAASEPRRAEVLKTDQR